MLPKKINSVKDVKTFFSHITKSGTAFHPDTSFGRYINIVTGKKTYSPAQIKKLNKLMKDSFIICKKNDVDIYGLAFDVVYKK